MSWKKILAYCLMLSLFPFIRSCKGTYGFPLVSIEGIGFFIKLDSISIEMIIINTALMSFLALSIIDLKRKGILKVSKYGIRFMMAYHIVVLISYFILSLPTIFIFFLPYFLIIFYPLEPFMKTALENFSKDASMRIAFVLMSFFWYLIGWLTENRKALLPRLKASNEFKVQMAALFAFIVSVFIVAGSYLITGVRNDSNALRKPNALEIAYNAIAPDYQSLEVCNKIGLDAVVTIGSWEGASKYYLRSDCFLGIAVASSNPEYCKYIKPVTTLISDGDDYTEVKCRKQIKQKDAKYEIRVRSFDEKKFFNEIGFTNDNLNEFCVWYKKALEDNIPAWIENLPDVSSKKEYANRFAKVRYEYKQCLSNNPDNKLCDKRYNEAAYGKKYCRICNSDCDQTMNDYQEKMIYHHLYAFLVRNEDSSSQSFIYPKLNRDILLEKIRNLSSF